MLIDGAGMKVDGIYAQGDGGGDRGQEVWCCGGADAWWMGMIGFVVAGRWSAG